jgi:hypothetical protein
MARLTEAKDRLLDVVWPEVPFSPRFPFSKAVSEGLVREGEPRWNWGLGPSSLFFAPLLSEALHDHGQCLRHVPADLFVAVGRVRVGVCGHGAGSRVLRDDRRSRE